MPPLTVSSSASSVFENAGPGAAQLTITRPPQAVLYITHNNQLLTHCQDGTAVSSTPVPYGVPSRPAGENVRDVIYGPTTFASVYNGTTTPYLSRLDTAAANPTWTHNTFTELSTTATASFGGIAAFQNFVFMTDMNTTGAALAGIVRFNTTTNAFQRFASTTDYIDVVLGLNNSLYGLRSSGNTVDVYNPTTMSLSSTVTLGQTVRAISVDATGRIFAASNAGVFYRFSANGVQQAQLNSGVTSLTDLDLDAYGLLVAGSTTGDVVETDVNFIAPVQFSVGNGTTFVAFRRESLGPMTVSLTNSDTTELSLPISVDFLAGQTSVTVSVDAVDDNLLDGTQSVTITAGALCHANGGTTIDVLDFETLTVSITATSMAENAGPNAITGRITRSNAGNDQTFTLVSSDTTEATVPATITIPAGLPFVTFPINAVDDSLLDGTQTVTISASAPQYIVGGDTIQVTDHETLTVAIAANSVLETVGLGATTGTVTRGNTDIAQALSVNISSSDTTELGNPGAVIIAAGQSSATFNIDTVDDNLFDGTQTVTLTPSAVGYVSVGDTIDVLDQENLSLTLGSASVAENAGANATTVTVRRLNTDIGSPLSVVLMSSDTSEATVPLNIIIPSGLAALTVPISAVDDNLLDGTQTATISAQAINYQTATINLNVTDHETVTVTANPNSFLESAGNGATTGTVTRSNTDNGSALTVTLASNDTTEATVPVSVIIPAGQASTTFSIDAVDDTSPDGTQVVTITPAATGYVGVNGTVNVLDNETLTVNVVAASVPENGGASATTVTVTRNDGQTGTALTVTLSSSDTSEATVPGTVTIPIGATSVTFNLDAVDDTVLDGPQTVTISASASGYVSGNDTVIVADAPLITDVGDQNINEDGATTALPFTLSDTAGDMTITAMSSNPTLIPVGNVVFGGSGFDRTATVTAAANQFGSATITITAGNTLASVSDTFVVNVASVNDRPTISDTINRITPEDVPVGPINFTIGDIETPAASLVVTAMSSNQTLVPNASVVLGGTGATRTVTVNPAANLSGVTTITLTVTDGNGDTAVDTFDVTVNTVADTPSVTNATTLEDTQTTSGLVVSRNAADGNEVTHFKITNITGGTLFQTDGTTAIVSDSFITVAQGQAGLRFTPALNSNTPGTFDVQASLSATNQGLGGSTATATITVAPVNDVPTLTPANPIQRPVFTPQLIDVAPGFGGSGAFGFTNVGGVAFFVAEDFAHGRELWKSDGTVAGTVLVKDIALGSVSSFPQQLTNVNGTLYFATADCIYGVKLWRSDGTEAGTVLIKEISDIGCGIIGATNVNGTLFFSSYGPNGDGLLWKSDGTAAGTVVVKAFPSVSPLPNRPVNLTDVAGTLFFSVDDGVHGYELWKSDGTANGTVLVRDIRPGPDFSLSGELFSARSDSFVNVNGTLFFVASDGIRGDEVWKSDATEAGTVRVTSIGPFGSDPEGLTNVNGTLFFTANDLGGMTDQHGRELWKTDGTTAGTVLVKDIFPGTGSSLSFGGTLLTNVEEKVFFQADDGINGRELWKSDGTTGGTRLVKDVLLGPSSAYFGDSANVNGTFFFSAFDDVHGYELWASDGTAPGTNLVLDINPGLSSSSPTFLANVGGKLFFRADDGPHGAELWVVNTTGPLPTTTHFAPQTTPEDVPVATINFTVGDVETAAVSLIVTATSSNQTLVPNANITLSGTGANRSLKITPAANQSGTVTITVTVSDGPNVVSDQFEVTVTSVPDRPDVTTALTREDTVTSSGLVVARSPADTPDVTHFKIDRVTGGTVLLNDGQTPVADGGFVTTTQSVFGLRFAPNPNFYGAATFRIRASTSASDAGLGTEAAIAFVEVRPVADTPSITDGASAQNQTSTSGLVISRNPADGAEVTHLRITNITGGSLFFGNGTTQIQDGDFVNFTQAAGGLKFKPNETSNGQGTFQVQAATGPFINNIGGDVVTARINITGPLTRMYRVYNRISDRHHFTTSRIEVNQLLGVAGGFAFDDESRNQRGFAVHSTAFDATSPIFRLYNLQSGIHYYTTNQAERAFLLQQNPVTFPLSQQVGWRDEGIEGHVFSTPQVGTTPIYHLYNVNSGSHLFTESLTQKNSIVQNFPTVWREDRPLGYGFAFSEQGLVTAATARRSAGVEGSARRLETMSSEAATVSEPARSAAVVGGTSGSRDLGGLLAVRDRPAISLGRASQTDADHDPTETSVTPRGKSVKAIVSPVDQSALVDAAWQQFGEQLADW